MTINRNGRIWRRRLLVVLAIGVMGHCIPHAALASDAQLGRTIRGGLDWLAYQQHKLGHWTADGR